MAVVPRASYRALFVLILLTIPWLEQALAEEWEHLERCVIVPSSLNDGDSFVIRRQEGEEIVIRLYFVDCAESSNLFPDRVRDQARYFGTTTGKIIELGTMTSSFVETVLREKEFSVHTMWEDGWGKAKRSLGVIVVDGKTLSEILVENGLARIHGFRPNSAWQGGVTSDVQLNRLEIAEKEAKRTQAGAWGDRKPTVKGVPIPGTAPRPSQPISPSSGLTNLNEATQSELTKLPHIGDVLAKRIREGRPWYEVEDLRLINGIGDQKMTALKSLVTVISSEAPEFSADFYRTNAAAYLNQRVTVTILNVKEVTWPAPDGFSVVQAFTGSPQKFGGAIPLFFPEEKREQVLAFYARESIGQTKATFFSYQGKPVLVVPRETSQPKPAE
ncbi:MAG: helix-hairpin-helix domain-containing protein [Verrucomicrobiota bacterium]